MGFDEDLDAALKTEESKPLDAVAWCDECTCWHFDDNCEFCKAIEIHESLGPNVKDALKELLIEKKSLKDSGMVKS